MKIGSRIVIAGVSALFIPEAGARRGGGRYVNVAGGQLRG